MSSNPFRRSQQPPPAIGSPPESRADSLFPSRLDDDAEAQYSPSRARKSVRISSPPQSPPQATAGPDRHDHLIERLRHGSHAGSPPPELPEDLLGSVDGASVDPFEWAATVDGLGPEDEELVRNTRRNSGQDELMPSSSGAPANPFHRTLATIEPPRSGGHVPLKEGPKRQERPVADRAPAASMRGSLDVDAFKRLLMTGSAAPAPQSPPIQPLPQTAGPAESGSSTDASSISRQSLFEPVPEAYNEPTPRTSYELSVSDDDSRPSVAIESRKQERKKPPPPKHRHGKLVTTRAPQTVSFADFAASIPSPTLHPEHSPAPRLQRTSSDLNKPLPSTPPTSSVQNAEDQDHQPRNQSTASPTSPSHPRPRVSEAQLSQKRPPPPVPLSRRQSQLRNAAAATSTANRSRSNSSITVCSQQSDTNAPSSQHKAPQPPPPPPPTRRHGASASITGVSSASNSIVDFPAVSKSRSTPLASPPLSTPASSVLPISSSSPTSSSHPPPPPPPPPPPRRNRGSNRSSFELARNDTNPEVARSSSELKRPSKKDLDLTTPPMVVRVDEEEEEEKGDSVKEEEEVDLPKALSTDVLADIARLQAEVDALRQKYHGVDSS